MTPLLLVLPWMMAAPVPKDFKAPEQVLVGTWEFVEATYSGRPDPTYLKARWELKKDGTAVRHLASDEDGTGTPAAYKFDATQKPKHFEWSITGSSFGGIYELQGDKLKVALPIQGDRPTEFAGQSVYVFTMKRVK